jgi:HK97 gp10 family phage protein
LQVVNLRIIGLNETLKKLDDVKRKSLGSELDAVVESGAKEFLARAKRDAPVDMGTLRNSITYKKLAKLRYEVVSGAEYSAYLEWGTITRVKVPAELQSYATQFRGKGLRKNGGIYPRPFFFPQVIPVKKLLEQRVKALI